MDLVAEVEAIAWVLAKGENMVPIPGTKREKYLIDNVGAADVKLTSEELKKLDDLSRVVAGERYDEGGMGLIRMS